MSWVTGNDIVDLGDSANTSPLERPRFVVRVCNEEERRALEGSSQATALLWSFFAAKEAAFKLACKLAGKGARPVFAHRSFEVDPTLARVRHDGRVFSLRVEQDAERVHAVVWTGSDLPVSVVSKVDRGGDPGTEARALLTRSLAPAFGCSAEMLTVVRDADPHAWDDLGPPRLLRGGSPVQVDVSLSHDGRFVACAACVHP